MRARSRTPRQLALRQRVQPHDLHTTCQRVPELRHQQHVGRARQHEAASHALAIHRRLQRGEEGGHPLHFVEDRPLRRVGDEAHGIGFGRASRNVVVEADIGVSPGLANHLGERGLASLARAVDQHHRRVGERLDQTRLGVARVEGGLNHRSIATLGLG